jgi:hypothetical protein
LKEFCTTKNDLKKNVSRIPLELSRLKHEDTHMESDRPVDNDDKDTMEDDISHRMAAF